MTHGLVDLVVAYVQFFYRMAVFAGLESVLAVWAPLPGASWQQWSYFSMVTLLTLVKLTIVACVAVGAPVWAAQVLWFLSRRAWTHARTVLLCAGIVAIATRAHAQLVVNDPLNTIQNTITAGEAVKELVKILELLQTMQRIAANAGDLGRYKTPPIIGVTHDIAAHPFAAATLTGLNSGDRDGALYMQNVHLLDTSVVPGVAALPAEAQRQMQTALASVDMTDSVNERTIQLMANSRAYGTSTARVLLELERTILSGRSGERYLTAVLEKIAGLALSDGRQRSVNIQVLSTVLEQLLARAKVARDQDVLVMNQRITALTADPAITGWVQHGADEAFLSRDVLH